MFFWLLGKFQTSFISMKGIKMPAESSERGGIQRVSELTLTSPGQRWFTDLPETNVLLHFIRSFVPATQAAASACYALALRDLGRGCRWEWLRLTGSGRLRPPTRARSWSRSRGGCRGAALAGTLQTASGTQGELIHAAEGEESGAETDTGTPLSH